MITYNSHPWVMFSTDWLSFGEWGGGWFKMGRPRSREGKKFGRRWIRGVGGLENWIIFMDVICVSSLNIT